MQINSHWSGPVDEWISIASGNCTHIYSSFNLEITANSPWASPWILHVPEILSTFIAVPCRQNCMVHVLSWLSAICNRINSSCVVLETSNGLEWYWNWSFFEQSLGQFLLITLSDIVASESDVSDRYVFSEDASSVLGSVRIVKSDWIPPAYLIYSKAWEGRPPLHTWLSNAPAQSKSCCSEKVWFLPFPKMFQWDLRAPTVEKSSIINMNLGSWLDKPFL